MSEEGCGGGGGCSEILTRELSLTQRVHKHHFATTITDNKKYLENQPS